MFEYIEKRLDRKDKYYISIVIPVYNEEKTIFSLLNKIPEKSYIEIIVIDDKSSDRSIDEIQKAQTNQNIKLIRHNINQGYGRAILTGIKRSKGDIIITMDSDGQHSPNDIYNLIKPILDNQADLSIGSRYLGSYYYTLPISTRLGELIVEKMLFFFFRQKIVNNQGGFRAISKKIIHIFDNIQFKNYAFTTEMVIKALLHKYRIKESPISLKNRVHGKSRIILNKLALNLILCFFRYLILKIKILILRGKKIQLKKKPLILREIS